MWLFNRKSTPKSSKPVQRQISIRTRDEQGDSEPEGSSFEPVLQQRSPGITRSSLFGSPLPHQEQAEEDETESTTTSDGHSSGRHSDYRASHNNSYAREPLDSRLWSSVTSPGFTTRAVQQANGNGSAGRISPLSEIMSNRSPFSRSPNGNLKIGQLPISAMQRRSVPSIMNFPSPRGRSAMTYGRYSRVGRRDGKTGTVFVKLAPVDLKGIAPPVTPTTPSPGNMSMSASGVLSLPSYNESGSPGLGGMPPTGLTQRFSRLWPNMPNNSNSPVSPGYQTPGPSNLVDALANRKRGRDTDAGSGSETNKAARQQQSAMTPVSTPEDINKYSKRVKFVNDQEMRLNRPLTFDSYHDQAPNGGQPMTSILEQMNQTEKRFLPDSSMTSTAKKTKIMSSPPRGSSTPVVNRKRRVNSRISMVEDDEELEDSRFKTGKFCHCNECYREAAGITTDMQTSVQKSPPSILTTPIGSAKKSVTFNETILQRERAKAAKEMESDDVEVIIRKANRSSGYITKEKYDDDRLRRLERFRRILGLTQPEESSKDQVDGVKPVISTTATNIPTAMPSLPITTPSSIQFSSTPTEGTATFGFGKPSGEDVLKKFGEPQLSSQNESSKPQEVEKDQPASNSSTNLSSGMGNVIPETTVSKSSATSFQSNLFSNSSFTQSPAKVEDVKVNLLQSGQDTVFKVEPLTSTISFKKEEPSTDQVFAGFGSQKSSSGIISTDSQLKTVSNHSGGESNNSTDAFKVATSTPSSSGANQSSLFGSTSQNATSSLSSSQAPISTSTLKSTTFAGAETSAVSPFGGTQNSSGGFSFGQSQSQPSANSQPSVVTFGQANQPQTSVSGGSNFSAQSPPSAFGAIPAVSGIFGLATTTTTASLSGFGSTNSNTVSTSGSLTNSFPSNSFNGIKSLSDSSKPSNQLSPFGAPSGMSQPNLFGAATSGTSNQSSNSAPAFGSSNFTGSVATTTSSPASNSFSFGGTQPSSGGFTFGQPKPQTAANPQPGVFNFGQASQPQSSLEPQKDKSNEINSSTNSASGMGIAIPETTVSKTSAPSFHSNLFSNSSLRQSPAKIEDVKPNPFHGSADSQLTTFSNHSGGGINTDAFKIATSPFGSSSGTNQSSLFGSMSQNATGTLNSNQASTSTPAFKSTTFAGAGTSAVSPFGGTQNSSGGFSFGQSQSQPSANPQPGVVTFGQANQPQTSGGFNFSAQSPPSSAFGAIPAASGIFGLATPTTTASLPGFGSTNTVTSLGTRTNSFPSNSFNGMNHSVSDSFKPSNQLSPFGAPSGTSQPNLFGAAPSMTSNQSSNSTTAFGSSNFSGSGASNTFSPAPNSFNFGSTQPQPSSGGFAFGQPQTQTAANSQPGVFNFGQASQPQSSPGGFDFGAQAQPPPPAYGAATAPGMFNLGTSTSNAQRSRSTRLRKYR